MITTARYCILVLLVLVALHSLLTLTNDAYGRATLSFFRSSSSPQSEERLLLDTSRTKTKWWWQDAPSIPKSIPDAYILDGDAQRLDLNGEAESAPMQSQPRPKLVNATLLMLARNSDAEGATRSVRSIEDRFNRKFGYPWVFLNDEPFSDAFKQRVSVVTSAPVSFAQIPAEHWNQPDWIDEERAERERNTMAEEGVIYGGSVSYRNMCRFNSGFFYRQPILQQYRWYWRVEPDVNFHCDVDYDPFRFMEDYNKTYGFTMIPYEFERTVRSLWDSVKEFTKEHPEHVSPDNLMGLVSDDNGNSYNMCHFWSNFEIADMDFWRSEAYSQFFDFLDRKGGFYYERWGDAPVHSIAAALFRRKDQVHFFNEIGYEHHPNSHCPQDEAVWRRGRCACDQGNTFDYTVYSCMNKWESLMS